MSLLGHKTQSCDITWLAIPGNKPEDNSGNVILIKAARREALQ